MEAKANIEKLIVKSLISTISHSEKALLEAWKAESRANYLVFKDYEMLWKESGRLSSTKHYDTKKALSIVGTKLGIYREKRFSIWYNVAAVLIISLLLNATIHLFTQIKRGPGEAIATYQEITAAYGTQTRLQLPDKTIVFLNSGSRLKYPVSFKGLDQRRVELTGEAFFEVDHNLNNPFIVDLEKLSIKVTGTRFNVSAYESSNEFSCALVEGEVEIIQTTARNSIGLVTLKPGEIARFNLIENRIYIYLEDDMEKHYAWVEGKIVFRDDPIQIVADKLSNWYNIDVEIADRRLDNYRFTGTFIEEPIDEILSVLSKTSPMKYRIIPSMKLDNNQNTRRKIILSSK